MKLFLKANGKRTSTITSNGYYCGNTIDDLLSGHFKNSYGAEGMGITGKSDWKQIGEAVVRMSHCFP